MIKKIALFLCFSQIMLNVAAQKKVVQDEEEEVKKPFLKKENLFVGGSVGLGFGTGQFSLGVGPYFGYSINKYVDVALSLNYNYISQRYENTQYKVRQSIIGPGAFVRIYPIKFLFAQAGYEKNFIKFREIYGSGFPDVITKYNVESFLVGAGYASDRENKGDGFFYISLLFDVANSLYSPYKDQYGRVNPIIRTGIHFPLFQNAKHKESKRHRQRNEE